MKTALLLSGMLREFEHCAPNILENIVKPTNADVFLFFSTDSLADAKKVVEIYKPIKFVWDFVEPEFNPPAEWVAKTRYNEPKHVKAIWHMWRQRKECFELLKNYSDYSTQYDYYINFRFDCKIDIKLNDQFFANCGDYSINIPEGGNWHGINDMMCVAGNYHIMYHYCLLFNYLKEYAYKPNLVFGHEELLQYHLTEKFTEIEWFAYSPPKIKRFPCDILLRKNFDGVVEVRKMNL